jgi:hypothetical protein
MAREAAVPATRVDHAGSAGIPTKPQRAAAGKALGALIPSPGSPDQGAVSQIS